MASMKKRVTAEMMKLVQSQLASRGGKARAEKYGKAKLSEWAKLGGRPKKKQTAAKKRGKRVRK
jgi:hypothetical protein